MGVNAFADLTGEEWKASFASGYRAKEKRSGNVNTEMLTTPKEALPTSVDWEAAGAVT